jgi:hypothetical protein
LKEQKPKDIFAPEVTEATEGFKFKSKKKRLTPVKSVWGCGVKFFSILCSNNSVLLTFRLSKFCKEDPFWKPTSEIPPNPPLVKGGRGDFWRALPHGNLFGCGFAVLYY